MRGLKAVSVKFLVPRNIFADGRLYTLGEADKTQIVIAQDPANTGITSSAQLKLS